MTLKVTNLKVPIEEVVDINDQLSCLGYPGDPKRCKGGRFTPDGYMCIYCGQDPDTGSCKAPFQQETDRVRKQIAEGKFYFNLGID